MRPDSERQDVTRICGFHANALPALAAIDNDDSQTA